MVWRSVLAAFSARRPVPRIAFTSKPLRMWMRTEFPQVSATPLCTTSIIRAVFSAVIAWKRARPMPSRTAMASSSRPTILILLFTAKNNFLKKNLLLRWCPHVSLLPVLNFASFLVPFSGSVPALERVGSGFRAGGEGCSRWAGLGVAHCAVPPLLFGTRAILNGVALSWLERNELGELDGADPPSLRKRASEPRHVSSEEIFHVRGLVDVGMLR